jgi:hypothetical protein
MFPAASFALTVIVYVPASATNLLFVKLTVAPSLTTDTKTSNSLAFDALSVTLYLTSTSSPTLAVSGV